MQANMGDVQTELMREALAASQVGTWEWNIEDDILRCDPMAAAMFGVAQERAMNGAPLGFFVDRLHHEDCQRLGAQIADLRRRGGPYVAEYRTVPQPGSVRWVLSRGRFERDATGVVGRACGIVIDVTESKQDGYVEGKAFFVADAGEPDTALERTTDHAIRMRETAEALGAPVFDRLRPMMNAVLYELGRLLGAQAASRHEQAPDDTPVH